MKSPFSDSSLRDWFFDYSQYDFGRKFKRGVIILGKSPFELIDFIRFISGKFHITTYNSKDINITKDIVVGAQISEEDKKKLGVILSETMRRHEEVYIYSQEMFLLACIGADPYVITDNQKRFNILNSLTKDHSTFKYLQSKKKNKYTWPLHKKRIQLNRPKINEQKRSIANANNQQNYSFCIKNNKSFNGNRQFKPKRQRRPEGKWEEDFGLK